MPARWTVEQILALAPDGQVAKAARGLARPDGWPRLGQAPSTGPLAAAAQAGPSAQPPEKREPVLWGECRGSGRTPYLVAVDLEGPAFKCSCPSRKRPCKHVLGLLLLARAEPALLRQVETPDWVRKWLAGRAARAKRARQPEEPVADPQAQVRRAARRLRRVHQGVDALARWMEDLVQQGLGSLPGRPPDDWATQAARLVDAQAPGLARWVRQMARIPTSGEGWPARLLDRLGRLHLLLEAFQRLEDLSPDLQEEVRYQVGWTQEMDALRRQAGQRDRWLVLSRRVLPEDHLRTQRTWLWGRQGRQAALVLEFASSGEAFPSNLIPGTDLDAELIFWPGSLPLRAAVKVQHAAQPMSTLPGYSTLLAALTAYGAALARNPWLESLLVPLDGVVPFRQGDGWAIRDGQDQVVPMALPPGEGWRLLAISGGHPLTLAGEWDGQYFWPLSAWTGAELIPLGGGP